MTSNSKFSIEPVTETDREGSDYVHITLTDLGETLKAIITEQLLKVGVTPFVGQQIVMWVSPGKIHFYIREHVVTVMP